ncbi:MAG: hypothetical protein AB1405_14570 [Bdellovibrionota bacterium]
MADKHVFVETNFLVDILRPVPGPDAESLYGRHKSRGLVLHVPWCCASEALRTLQRIIDEDLGFDDKLMRFVVAEYKKDPENFDKAPFDKLRQQLKDAKTEALKSLPRRLDQVMASVELIEPSRAAVDRVIGLFKIKSLKPWDEMVAGCVLARMTEIRAKDATAQLYFCSLDKGYESGSDGWKAQFAALKCIIQSDFDVP